MFFEAQNTSLKLKNELTSKLKIDCVSSCLFWTFLLHFFLHTEDRVIWILKERQLGNKYDCSLPANPCLSQPPHLYLVNSYSAAFSKAFYSLIKYPQNNAS